MAVLHKASVTGTYYRVCGFTHTNSVPAHAPLAASACALTSLQVSYDFSHTKVVMHQDSNGGSAEYFLRHFNPKIYTKIYR